MKKAPLEPATVIHNPTSGDSHLDKRGLLRLLRRAGYRPTYYSTRKKNWKKALHRAAACPNGGLVVAAGGDGTIRRAALELAGRQCPLAILPLGTANNVARCLGITGSFESIVESWRTATHRRLDIGTVFSPWGRLWFLEGAGLGWFGETMADVTARPDPKVAALPRAFRVRRSFAQFLGTIATAESFAAEITLDGRTIAGEYLLVAALNMASIGPNLLLAPGADPADGRLDVVLIRAKERAKLTRYLELSHGHKQPRPPFRVLKARRICIRTDPKLMHVDDMVKAKGRKANGRTGATGAAGPAVKRADNTQTIDIAVWAGAVEFLLPSTKPR